MSGEQPTKAKLVDDQAVPSLRTGNHDRRPRSLLPTTTGNSQSASWDTSQPIACLIKAPAPPSGSCTPLTSNQQQQQSRQLGAGPPFDQTLNPEVYYTATVQYANVTPNRACSMLVDWERPDEARNDERQPSSSAEASKLQPSNSQMLNVRNPPPELSVSPADTLSKPSSSDNLSAFSPIASLNNEPLNDSFPRFHSLQHRSRKHRKFKQISPLNSPIWPSSQFDTFNRPSSQPHSPSRCV